MASNHYVLTIGALEDIREIADWSLLNWGKAKTIAYLNDLHQGLIFIAANFKTFENNKTREDLSGGTGLLLYPINKHYVVFVPVSENTIAVAAVIRQGRDIASILQKDAIAIRRELQEIVQKNQR